MSQYNHVSPLLSPEEIRITSKIDILLDLCKKNKPIVLTQAYTTTLWDLTCLKSAMWRNTSSDRYNLFVYYMQRCAPLTNLFTFIKGTDSRIVTKDTVLKLLAEVKLYANIVK